MDDTELLRFWRQALGQGERDQRPLCPIAAAFYAKLEDTIFVPLSGKNATKPLIAQAKYMLQELYHAWKKSVPAPHLQAAHTHERCLTEAYDAAYDRLHLMDLTARPPINVIVDYEELTKPTPVTAPAARTLPVAYGTVLGEIEE